MLYAARTADPNSEEMLQKAVKCFNTLRKALTHCVNAPYTAKQALSSISALLPSITSASRNCHVQPARLVMACVKSKYIAPLHPARMGGLWQLLLCAVVGGSPNGLLCAPVKLGAHSSESWFVLLASPVRNNSRSAHPENFVSVLGTARPLCLIAMSLSPLSPIVLCRPWPFATPSPTENRPGVPPGACHSPHRDTAVTRQWRATSFTQFGTKGSSGKWYFGWGFSASTNVQHILDSVYWHALVIFGEHMYRAGYAGRKSSDSDSSADD